MTALLTVEPSLSPRLAWLQLHRVHTARDFLPRCPGPYNEKPWRCSSAGRTINVWGDSEDDVIWGWCRAYGVEHYDSAGWDNLKCSDCGDPEPCSHDFDKENRVLENIGRIMGTDLLPGTTLATSEVCYE